MGSGIALSICLLLIPFSGPISGPLFAPASANELFPEIVPDPAYTPEEVVGIQMRALGQNDKPFENAGIELTFRFASPNNQRNTGPLARFEVLFENLAYKPMLSYASMEIGESMIVNGSAMVPVLLDDMHGKKVGYMFTLSQQIDPPYENCWMTDRVVRVQLPNNSSSIL